MKYEPTPCKGKSFKNIRILIYRLMVHVNETIVIKSSSPKLAEWVKRLKAHKAEQLEKLRNVEKCDFEFQFWYLMSREIHADIAEIISKDIHQGFDK